MRKNGLAWSITLVLAGMISCSDGNTDGGGCNAGEILCSGACVVGTVCPSGTTTGTTTGTTGTTTGVTGTTGTTGTTTGVTGTTGTTGTTTGVTGTTGTTGTTTGTAVGGTGGTSSTAKGGTTATGGVSTTPTSTGPWVDPDPSSCNDSSLFMLKAQAQYKKMQFSLDPSKPANDPGKTYVETTNWWGKYTNQTVAFNGLGYTVTGSSSTDNPSNPAGYPAFYIGSYQQTITKNSGMPKLVSAIKSVPMVFDTNVTSLSGDLNASIDVWFNTSSADLSATANEPTGGFLMVWLNKPGNKQPRGSEVMSNQTISGVSGTWSVWSDSKCVSYVRTSATNALTFDLNAFIKHAVSNNKVIQNSWYLAVIFGGFEIWSGGDGAKVNKFCAKVN